MAAVKGMLGTSRVTLSVGSSMSSTQSKAVRKRIVGAEGLWEGMLNSKGPGPTMS